MTKYIGARYMPKFMGTYDATTSYEALSVVDNGMGSTYVSNKPAPAGTPLTDTEFWAPYGSSSGAIINLQNQIDQLDTDVAALQKLHERKFIFIGDSYGHSSGTNNGWIDKVVTKLGLTASDYWDSAVGGGGFTIPGLSFETALLTILSGMTADEKASVTDVVVMGGANDTGETEANTAIAINSFVSIVNLNLPKAIIHVGMCAGNYANNVIGVRLARTLRGYLAGSGYSYINNIEYVFHDRSLIGSDKVHPTDTGYERLANFLYAYLIGGNYEAHYRERPTVTVTGGHLTSPINIDIMVDNDVTTVYSINWIEIELDTAQNITQTLTKSTGLKLNSNLFFGTTDSSSDSYCPAGLPMTVGLYSNIDSTYHNIECFVHFTNGELFISNRDATSVGTLDVPMRQISKIWLPSFKLTCPSMYC